MRDLGIEVVEEIAHVDFVLVGSCVFVDDGEYGPCKKVEPRAAERYVEAGLAFLQRSFQLDSSVEQSEAHRAMDSVHVAVSGAYVHHARQSSAVAGWEPTLVEIHVFHHIDIKRGEKSQGMVDLVERGAVEQEEVLVAVAAVHIESADQFHALGHSAHLLQRLHHVGRG